VLLRVSASLATEATLANNTTTNPTTNPTYDRSLMQTTLSQCETLLADYDGEAVDVLMESSDLIIEALGVELHKQVMRAAKQFDFDVALVYLRQGAKLHGFQVNLHSIE